MLKDILQIGQKKFLQLKKIKIQFHGYMLLTIFIEKKLLELSMKKSFRKQTNKEKGNKLYVKWKGCDNSFNSWIAKNDVI